MFKIYDYKCSTCGHEREYMLRDGVEPDPCPACSGTMTRMPAAPGFNLKGSGFYKSGYSGKK